MNNKAFLFFPFIFLYLLSCGDINTNKTQPLPIIGERSIVGGDTLYHTIPDFKLTNQDSQLISNDFFKDKIYISDFFFISCPTICPRVKKQMLRIYKRYENNPNVILVSHTIDPKRDTEIALKNYAKKLHVDTKKWIFLRGNKSGMFDLANEYFVVAMDAPEAPGGFDHSGKIILVDPKRHVRGFAEGTDPESVSKFFDTIDRLLNEYNL